jgi:hypothetical protein
VRARWWWSLRRLRLRLRWPRLRLLRQHLPLPLLLLGQHLPLPLLLLRLRPRHGPLV